MRFCNVILAIDPDAWVLLRQNWQRDEDGNRLRNDFTDEEVYDMRNFTNGRWGILAESGELYRIVDWFPTKQLTQDETELYYVDLLQETANTITGGTGKVVVVAAFDKDTGFIYGAEWQDGARDGNGDYIVPPPPPEPTGWTRKCYTDEWKLVACNDPDASRLVWFKDGTELYPQHPRALEAMPDQPATEFPVDLALRAGQAVRKWI